jgi:superoxide dismutase, Fe-Mn family
MMTQPTTTPTSVPTTTRRDLLRTAIPAAALASTGFFAFEALAQENAMPGAGVKGGTGMKGYFDPSNFFADGEWKLPKLPYEYNALEPHIDAQTMEIHHSKHHQSYVNNLNKALKTMKDLKDDATPSQVEALQRDISFNFGGHALHSMFWGIMDPAGGKPGGKPGGEPSGRLGEMLNAQFGSFERFKGYFTKVATSVKGSGWAILAFAPVSQQLITYAVKDQDSTHAPGTMPILGVDVWEHAYYLKYQNKRDEYVKAWFNTINWSIVERLMGIHTPG